MNGSKGKNGLILALLIGSAVLALLGVALITYYRLQV